MTNYGAISIVIADESRIFRDGFRDMARKFLK
jgi:hypothetical protein